MINSSEKVSQVDLKKTFEKMPNSDFKTEGDKVSLKFSGKEVTLKDLIISLSSTLSIPQKQVEQLIKVSKNIDISKLSIKLVVDRKAHKTVGSLSGCITITEDKSSINLNISMSSKLSKLKESLVEPASTDTNTLEEIQNAAFSNLMTQSE